MQRTPQPARRPKPSISDARSLDHSARPSSSAALAPADFSLEQNEPVFIAISENDPEFHAACARSRATVHQFIQHIKSGINGSSLAKLGFRNPDRAEPLPEDISLWLTDVHYHDLERSFSGVFFEIPAQLQKSHRVGQRLAFEATDILDWMFLTEAGRLYGGYTLRVVRSKLPETQRADYDRYIGITAYEPEP
jgi:uncharacterized protein YegJ (DUF2314 family)